MAWVLGSGDIQPAIDEMIRKSGRYLYLAGRDLVLPEILQERISGSGGSQLDVRLYYNDHFLVNSKDDIAFLRAHENVRVFVCAALDACCCLSESGGIISSSCRTDLSRSTMLRLGLSFTASGDPGIHHDMETFLKKIEGNSRIQDEFEGRALQDDFRQEITRAPASGRERRDLFTRFFHEAIAGGGYCIRCGTPMEYRIGMPLCRGCFSEWAKSKNQEKTGSYCHNCGASYPVTMKKPLCSRCYRDATSL
jgi:hypothetical protein